MVSLEQLRAWARAGMFAPVTLRAAVERMGFVQAGPDPGAGAGPGSDPPAPGRGIPGGRSGSWVPAAAPGGRFPLCVWVHVAGDAPRCCIRGWTRRAGRTCRPGWRPTCWRSSGSAGRRIRARLEAAFGAGAGRQRLGRLFAGEHAGRSESLRHYGLLRVHQRQDGIRVYEAAPVAGEAVPAAERARGLVMLVARLLAPVSEVSLRRALALMARHNPGLGTLPPVIALLCRDGALRRETVDGEAYLWPEEAGWGEAGPARREVRLLSPFDPVVWDRRRFERIYGGGPIGSRRMFRRPSASAATTRCRCCGATSRSGGRTCRWWRDGCRRRWASRGRRPAARPSTRALEAEIGRMERFLSL